jgi:hypothetical protein
LVLPPSELGENDSLRTSFERDGRWALVSLSAYFGLALVTDWLLWSVSPFSLSGAMLMLLILLPLGFVWSRSRPVQEVITILYVPLSIGAALELSPAAY